MQRGPCPCISIRRCRHKQAWPSKIQPACGTHHTRAGAAFAALPACMESRIQKAARESVAVQNGRFHLRCLVNLTINLQIYKAHSVL